MQGQLVAQQEEIQREALRVEQDKIRAREERQKIRKEREKVGVREGGKEGGKAEMPLWRVK